MSSFTAPAFVAHGPYGSESRKHPALAWVEKFVNTFFDSGDHGDSHEWFAKDFSAIKTDGEHEKASREEAFDNGVQHSYPKAIIAHKHVPYTMIAMDHRDGWDLYIQVNVYMNLAGSAAANEKKTKDPHGNEWHLQVPAFYHMDIVKRPEAKHDGMLIRHIKIISDRSIIHEAAANRGVKLDE